MTAVHARRGEAVARFERAARQMRVSSEMLAVSVTAARDEILAWTRSLDDAGTAVRGSRPLEALVVEDDTAVRHAAVRELVEAFPDGSVVSGVPTADAAVALAITERFDAIVLDLSLPGIHGAKAAELLRDGPNRHAVIVLISGVVREQLAAVAQSVRADAFLEKPWNHGELAETVLRVVSAKARTGG